MKRYKFKLQKLQDVRTFREKEEQVKFSKVLKEYVDSETKINNYYSIREQYILSSKEYIMNNQFNLLAWRDSTITSIKNAIIIENKRLKELEYLLEKAREVLIEASRDKKILDILKDKSWKRYVKDFYKDENAINDEVANVVFLKKTYAEWQIL